MRCADGYGPPVPTAPLDVWRADADAEGAPPYCVGPFALGAVCAGHGVVDVDGRCACDDTAAAGHWNGTACATCAGGWTGPQCRDPAAP